MLVYELSTRDKVMRRGRHTLLAALSHNSSGPEQTSALGAAYPSLLLIHLCSTLLR